VAELWAGARVFSPLGEQCPLILSAAKEHAAFVVMYTDAGERT